MTPEEALDAIDALPIMTRDQCLKWLTSVALTDQFTDQQRIRAVGMLMDADISSTVTATDVITRIGLSDAEGATEG